jgi:hypothetical protein
MPGIRTAFPASFHGALLSRFTLIACLNSRAGYGGSPGSSRRPSEMPERPDCPKCRHFGNAAMPAESCLARQPCRGNRFHRPRRSSRLRTRREAPQNPAQRNAPLGAMLCEGEVTVTDPCHPLFQRTFKLVNVAVVPGHVRQCQVELFPGIYGRIPVSSTNLSAVPRPEPTVLTLPALEELVACFLAQPVARRARHATDRQSKRVGSSVQRPASRGHRRVPSHSHRGGGK